MSIAGGLHRALEHGEACGCEVVQLFTAPNKQWATRPIGEVQLERWVETRSRTGVEPALAHDSYLINLASPTASSRRQSRAAFAQEYARCGLLGIPFLVMHPGAHLGAGEAAGIGRIAEAISRTLEAQPDNPSVVLLENTAGQGTSIGYRFEHLRDLIGATDAGRRLGVCLDTCHTLAAGYDLTTAAGWEATFAEFEQVVGLGAIRAFHVNDSKRPLGSRVDRHEHIGRGHLGLTAFRLLMSDDRFVGLPMTLETPKVTPEADAINLAILRALAGKRRVTQRARRLAAQSLDQSPVG